MDKVCRRSNAVVAILLRPLLTEADAPPNGP